MRWGQLGIRGGTFSRRFKASIKAWVCGMHFLYKNGIDSGVKKVAQYATCGIPCHFRRSVFIDQLPTVYNDGVATLAHLKEKHMKRLLPLCLSLSLLTLLADAPGMVHAAASENLASARRTSARVPPSSSPVPCRCWSLPAR